MEGVVPQVAPPRPIWRCGGCVSSGALFGFDISNNKQQRAAKRRCSILVGHSTLLQITSKSKTAQCTACTAPGVGEQGWQTGCLDGRMGYGWWRARRSMFPTRWLGFKFIFTGLPRGHRKNCLSASVFYLYIIFPGSALRFCDVPLPDVAFVPAEFIVCFHCVLANAILST